MLRPRVMTRRRSNNDNRKWSAMVKVCGTRLCLGG